MQPLVPTGARNPNGHVQATIYSALTGKYGSRKMSFRYELLTNSHARVGDLETVIADSFTIEHQYLADVKRKASFRIRDLGEINFLSDRVKPYVRLHLPPFGTNDWVEWPQGVFLLSSPTRNADEHDRVHRDVEAYDPLQFLLDDRIATRLSYAAGTNIVSAVKTLVQGAVPTWRVTNSAETLTAAKEFEPGREKLFIANELLSMAEYHGVHFDHEGVGILTPYQSPEDQSPEWTYAFGPESLIIPNVDQELDLFAVANKWVVVVSEPDQPMLTASYTNTNPASPTSTVRRGRTIVDFRQEEEASSQTVLNNKVRRYAFEASQIYEHIKFSTSMIPLHGLRDAYTLRYGPLAIDAKYSETAWSMTLAAGAQMSHEARRVVSV